MTDPVDPADLSEDAAQDDLLCGDAQGEAGSADRRSLTFVQLLPNMVTLLGLCAGLTSIRYGLEGAFEWAAALIVVAAIIDGMDGLLARKLNAASHFGAELDSLSDFVCFGVAPGILVYRFALGDLPAMGWLLVLVFTLGACLRLARFNVARNAPASSGHAHFVGVPAPAGAMLGLLPVFLALAGWVPTPDWPAFTAVYVAIVGLLMISRLPTPSIKAWKVPRNRAVLLLLGVTVYAGALVTKPWAVLILTDLAYLAVVVRSAWTHRRRLA
ncbi:MAG: CDP-diacylglycerol--serine O-phosphatidyltransferase [Rhodobacteraceae bacterium]|nr:CDP-diacylglycerol--serine O-phosphatidyltransferase [Paracoccaceae bacterium]